MNSTQIDRTLTRIEADLHLISRKFGLIPAKQHPVLLKDIKYLLLDNIARGVKLVIYDADRNDRILFEHKYTLDGLKDSDTISTQLDKDFHPELSFDVFIEFTDTFLSLDNELQTLLLKNTEFDWYPYK